MKPAFTKTKKRWETLAIVFICKFPAAPFLVAGFCAYCVFNLYTGVGTGESYCAAFALLNLFVNLETFLEAAFL